MSLAEPQYRRERTRIGKVSLSTKVYQGVGALPEPRVVRTSAA